MARPNKTGLDYFPLDIDFFDDEKIVAISGEFGIKGEIVAIKRFVRYTEMDISYCGVICSNSNFLKIFPECLLNYLTVF